MDIIVLMQIDQSPFSQPFSLYTSTTGKPQDAPQALAESRTKKSTLPAPAPQKNTVQIASAQGRAQQELKFAEAPLAPARSVSALADAEAALAAGRPPGQPGPFEVRKLEMTLGGNQVDVYLPVGKGPFPLNIYSTGLLGGQRDAKANSNHFASWGIATIVPSLGGNFDPVKSGKLVEKILSDLSQRRVLDGTPIQPQAIAVSGHSFGGLTASLAADHPAVKALLALDPNDNAFQSKPGLKHAHQVEVPAAFIFGDGGPNDLGPGIYENLGSTEKYAIELKNMPHNNFISTSQWPNRRGQQRALDFATAFLLAELGGLKGVKPYLDNGSQMKAAEEARELKKL